jgi:C-terminal processing protease CtpA/Prc
VRSLRAFAAALLLCAGCGGALLGPAPSDNYAALFDDVWRQFDLHYAQFDLRRVNWDSVGARYRPQALAARSDAELAAVLGRMLGELRDVHVSLTPFGPGSTIRSVARFDTAATNFSADVVFERYVVLSAFTNERHLQYGWATPTIGYIRIPSFSGAAWDGDADVALEALKGAESIIVDVRNNPGGNYTVAKSVAGRFADDSRTFGYLKLRNGPSRGDFTGYLPERVSPDGPRQFRGRVFVLANRRTVSAAENFVLAMRALPSVTVVGDTTAGASGGPIVRELPNGWTFQLSEWVEFDAERRTFEGVGLAPDVAVRATALDAKRRTDAVLERALGMAR